MLNSEHTSDAVILALKTLHVLLEGSYQTIIP